MSTQGLSMTAFQVGAADTGPWARLIARTGALRRPAVTNLLIDIVAISIAVLDVWLVIPEDAPDYSIVLSGTACVALVGRRWFPFLTLLATVPGFMVGWAQIAAMLALGFLAHRKGMSWQTWVGAALVLACRFVLWPLADMVALTWREHVLDLIYGVIVAGMPVAIAWLILARRDLSRRLAELDASRDRERRLHARAVRADERARLAREMHDVVSHDVTLITMQANALEVAATPEAARHTADTIRQLSTRTLEELRSLVGVLRSSSDEEPPRPGLSELEYLIRAADMPVQLTVDSVPGSLPSDVSAAAYRTVQEALTNVHKHAPGATAIVRVSLEDRALRVEIRNDRSTEPSRGLPSGGYGLAGLAERALLLDGSFHARSTDDGGFEVRAHFPVGSTVTP
ncbi:MAG: histidine kinase [Haloechinothrix sp.]